MGTRRHYVNRMTVIAPQVPRYERRTFRRGGSTTRALVRACHIRGLVLVVGVSVVFGCWVFAALVRAVIG